MVTLLFTGDTMVSKGKISYLTVYYTNGATEKTGVNPNLTDAAVRNYFKVGRVFNLGRGEHDRMTKIKKVVIHREG